MNSDNSPAFSIRAAAAGDEGAIVALLRELAQYEKLESRFRLDEAAVRRDMLGNGAVARCDVLESVGEIAGLATWFWTYASFSARRVLYVEDLYITPRFRAQGFGKALLSHLARQAKAQDGMMAWLVLDWNSPAIEFYRAFGAEPTEDWTRYFVDGDALGEVGVMITLVVAAAKNGVIGKDGAIPWRLPEDLKRFKSLTLGHTVVMGRKTWDSLPEKNRPLPGRRNIVVTRDADWRAEGAERAMLEDALQGDDIFVIGGGEIYRAALARAGRIELTEVQDDFDGDAVFTFDRTQWQEVAREDHATPDGLAYSFVTLERR